MKNVLMITTGGTISSVYTNEGIKPTGSYEILKHIESSKLPFNLHTLDLLTLDSTNVQPEEWKIIADAVYQACSKYDGVVITHGTDTMAYTASMLSFMLVNPPIPIVLTGSQLPISAPETDAISNIYTAFSMATSNTGGVYIAFNRKIILGTRGVKTRTSSYGAFESINMQYVGVLDRDGLSINETVLPPKQNKSFMFDTKIDTNVFLLKLTPGTDPNIIDLLLETGIHGIVIEAFGTGGIQIVRRDFSKKIELATSRNIPVVVCSQCLYEGSDFSIYEVGRKALEKGAIQAYDMTTESTITKLMWALAHYNTVEQVKNFFELSIAGELDVKHVKN